MRESIFCTILEWWIDICWVFFPLQEKKRSWNEEEEEPEKQRPPSISSVEEEYQPPLSPTTKVCVISQRRTVEILEMFLQTVLFLFMERKQKVQVSGERAATKRFFFPLSPLGLPWYFLNSREDGISWLLIKQLKSLCLLRLLTGLNLWIVPCRKGNFHQELDVLKLCNVWLNAIIRVFFFLLHKEGKG